MARNKYPELTIERILDAATELFLSKGYEKTTIQDIINALGDLSKGAIYHHFKSKEEIIIAVVDRLFLGVSESYFEMLDASDCNSLEKLKKYFRMAMENPRQEIAARTVPNLLENPRLLALQMDTTINDLAPRYIGKIVREGIADGSIQTEYPEELSQVICLLVNIWMNPKVFECSPEELIGKYKFLQHLMKSQGVDIFDDELIEPMKQLAAYYNADVT